MAVHLLQLVRLQQGLHIAHRLRGRVVHWAGSDEGTPGGGGGACASRSLASRAPSMPSAALGPLHGLLVLGLARLHLGHLGGGQL